MKGLTKHIATFILFLFVGLSVIAQNNKAEQLRIRKTQLQDEIQLANKILNETRTNEKKTMGEMRALVQKIKMRE